MMRIEIIDASSAKPVLLEKLKIEDFSDTWRPHINESIVLESGQYKVEGVAHMWDKMTIKVFVTLLFKHI